GRLCNLRGRHFGRGGGVGCLREARRSQSADEQERVRAPESCIGFHRGFLRRIIAAGVERIERIRLAGIMTGLRNKAKPLFAGAESQAFSSPAYFSINFFCPKPGKLTVSFAPSPVPS